MKELPEYIKYRAQSGFAFGVMLMTPALTLMLKILTFDIMSDSEYNTYITVFDFVIGIIGFFVVRWSNHYLADKEQEYGKLAE